MSDKHDTPLQLCVTKIAPEVYRVVVFSDKRTLYTANVEQKFIHNVVARELAGLGVIDWRDEK